MPRARPLVRPFELVVTCEHGGNRIPSRYQRFFRGAEGLLASHRGYDPGALALARDFARAFDAKLFHSTLSRLLVELNRSVGHRQSFSPRVPRAVRQELIARYYGPYRAAVEASIAHAIRRGRRVVHLSCHSFAPRLAGVRRTADVGLLYDPRRVRERRLCTEWRIQLARQGRLAVKLNYPYRGTGDGFTTDLRERFSEQDYLGIELEVNQRFPRAGGPGWRRLRRLLIAAFREALQQTV